MRYRTIPYAGLFVSLQIFYIRPLWRCQLAYALQERKTGEKVKQNRLPEQATAGEAEW